MSTYHDEDDFVKISIKGKNIPILNVHDIEVKILKDLVIGVDINSFEIESLLYLWDSPTYTVQSLRVMFKACLVKTHDGVLLHHARLMSDNTTKYLFIGT